RKESMPPLCSIVRIAAALIRSGIAPSTSESTETYCKLGRKRRFVLILEWLTLCPTWTPLPVITHFRAIPHLNRLPRHQTRARDRYSPAARSAPFTPASRFPSSGGTGNRVNVTTKPQEGGD